MKKIFKSAVLAVSLIAASSSAFAIYPNDAVLDGSITGEGCIVGNGEYGTKTFSFSGGHIDHGEVANLTTFARTASLTVLTETVPAACEDVEINVVVTGLMMTSVSGSVVDQMDFAVTGDGTMTVKDLQTASVNISWGVQVNNTTNDLVTAFDYTKPFTVSVTAVQP